MKRWYWTLLCLPLLHACGKPAGDDYFPLSEGLRWDYQVTITQPHRSDSKTLTIENWGTESVKDTSTTVRRTSDGTDYYLTHKDDGVYRIAKRTIVEELPQLDESPRMVLPNHPTTAQGKMWSSITMPYMILRVFEGDENAKADEWRFPMQYSVKSVDETVDVPAGRFTHCVLVEGQAEVTMYTDPRKGETAIPITTREWYAPSVGLVKLERDEPLNTDVFKGGKLVMELTQFED
jgi:hypothetical protein